MPCRGGLARFGLRQLHVVNQVSTSGLYSTLEVSRARVQIMFTDAQNWYRTSSILSEKLRRCLSRHPSRPWLHSTSSQRCDWQCMRLKFGERSFSCAGLRACNSLPSSLH